GRRGTEGRAGSSRDRTRDRGAPRQGTRPSRDRPGADRDARARRPGRRGHDVRQGSRHGGRQGQEHRPRRALTAGGDPRPARSTRGGRRDPRGPRREVGEGARGPRRAPTRRQARRRAARAARRVAESTNVDVRQYKVIYELLDDVQKALTGLLEPEMVESTLGHAEVRQIFTSGKTTIAGCMVVDGVVRRGAQARLLRGGTAV